MTGSTVGMLTPASPQHMGVVSCDVMIALMSLGDRHFSAPLYSYRTSIIRVGIIHPDAVPPHALSTI